MDRFEIFMAAPPGLEAVVAAEAAARGFADPQAVPGGVTVQGGWPDVWRANLEMRGAGRVLARIGAFRAMHLAQLDKRARKFPWGDVLRADVPLRVEVTTHKSRIYHAGAATQRIERALVESFGAVIAPEATLILKVRIADDMCSFSVDTSGAALHIRNHKEWVGKAPMRENMAALFLRQIGFDGSQTLVDPMCGSGTFVIEAAEIAAGMQAGRSRQFAFADLASFDTAAWAAMQRDVAVAGPVRFYGYDRDDGAIRGATANAARAGVGAAVAFGRQAVMDLMPPEGPPGIVMVNPPYGSRIGQRKLLFSLYGALGKTLAERFRGWRVGLVTSDAGLAKATGLAWEPPGPAVSFGGLKVTLWQGRV